MKALLTKHDFTAESLKMLEFVERNGVSGQASAGIGGTHSQKLMVTAQTACARTVVTTLGKLSFSRYSIIPKDANNKDLLTVYSDTIRNMTNFVGGMVFQNDCARAAEAFNASTKKIVILRNFLIKLNSMRDDDTARYSDEDGFRAEL